MAALQCVGSVPRRGAVAVIRPDPPLQYTERSVSTVGPLCLAVSGSRRPCDTASLLLALTTPLALSVQPPSQRAVRRKFAGSSRSPAHFEVATFPQKPSALPPLMAFVRYQALGFPGRGGTQFLEAARERAAIPPSPHTLPATGSYGSAAPDSPQQFRPRGGARRTRKSRGHRLRRIIYGVQPKFPGKHCPHPPGKLSPLSSASPGPVGRVRPARLLPANSVRGLKPDKLRTKGAADLSCPCLLKVFPLSD